VSHREEGNDRKENLLKREGVEKVVPKPICLTNDNKFPSKLERKGGLFIEERKKGESKATDSTKVRGIAVSFTKEAKEKIKSAAIAPVKEEGGEGNRRHRKEKRIVMVGIPV